MGRVAIFAIDNNHDLHTTAKFLRYLDTLRAMNKLKGEVQLCVGMWENSLEPSYIMNEEDFNSYVRNSSYVENQKELFYTEELNLTECDFKEKAWTFKLKEGKYYCVA